MTNNPSNEKWRYANKESCDLKSFRYYTWGTLVLVIFSVLNVGMHPGTIIKAVPALFPITAVISLAAVVWQIWIVYKSSITLNRMMLTITLISFVLLTVANTLSLGLFIPLYGYCLIFVLTLTGNKKFVLSAPSFRLLW